MGCWMVEQILFWDKELFFLPSCDNLKYFLPPSCISFVGITLKYRFWFMCKCCYLFWFYISGRYNLEVSREWQEKQKWMQSWLHWDATNTQLNLNYKGGKKVDVQLSISISFQKSLRIYIQVQHVSFYSPHCMNYSLLEDIFHLFACAGSFRRY